MIFMQNLKLRGRVKSCAVRLVETLGRDETISPFDVRGGDTQNMNRLGTKIQTSSCTQKHLR